MQQIRSDRRPGQGLSSAALHGIAMGAMLCDHIRVAGLAETLWLTCVGRIAFPIYGFLLVEGYFHTGDLKKYALRLLAAALLSEIPFDLMSAGRIWDWGHQNVIWTLLLSLGVIFAAEKGKSLSQSQGMICMTLALLAGFALALVLRVDYGYGGIFTVLTFYLFRGQGKRERMGQLFLLAFIDLAVLESAFCRFSAFGTEIRFPVQLFAVLSLFAIWRYSGRLGCSSKSLRYLYYGFYPLHMWILAILSCML